MLPRDQAVGLSEAELEALTALLGRLLDASGAAILPHFREPLDVANKLAHEGRYDPVTAADRAAEDAIRAILAAEHPEHGIYGEELGFTPGRSPLTWVIDPIDGTRAFVNGYTFWGTVLGLHDGARPIIGAVDQPFVGERFLGGPGGAWYRRNGQARRLSTRPCGDLGQASVRLYAPRQPSPAMRAALQEVYDRAMTVGACCDCSDFCMLAHGLLDLVVQPSLNAYDVHGVIPLVEAAGGVITTFAGAPAHEGGDIVAAGDPALHAAALDILSHAA